MKKTIHLVALVTILPVISCTFRYVEENSVLVEGGVGGVLPDSSTGDIGSNVDAVGGRGGSGGSLPDAQSDVEKDVAVDITAEVLPDVQGSDVQDVVVVDVPTDVMDGGTSMTCLSLGYCIDNNEVSQGQYQDWIDSNPVLTGLPSWCPAGIPATQPCAWSTPPQYPVNCVNWCQAYAYCRDMGKQLCGSIAGGSSTLDDAVNSSLDMWSNACTSNGQYLCTTGNSCDGTGCNAGTSEAQPTNADVDCHSPDSLYASILDLNGNAREWQDACGTEASQFVCLSRGGAYTQDMGACAIPIAADPMHVDLFTGFRCCLKF